MLMIEKNNLDKEEEFRKTLEERDIGINEHFKVPALKKLKRLVKIIFYFRIFLV